MAKPGTKIRNAEATKSIILNAAEEIFAEKGFAGTSIREISEKSGLSGPLILFHFQNKEGVYDGVKTAVVKRYTASQSGMPDYNGNATDFIKDLIQSMFAFYRDNPTMMRLANWARLEGDMDPWPGEDKLHHVYEDFLRDAQLKREIRDDISPFNISAIICGAVHIWWEYHDHFLQHERSRGVKEHIDERYLNQLLAFVLRGLSPEQHEIKPVKKKGRKKASAL